MKPENFGIGTFRCGHFRDVYNTKNAGKKNACCRTCYRASRRRRYRLLRDEGLTPNEIYGYRPLNSLELAAMLERMSKGMTLCQATAGLTGNEHSTLYRKLRIWAPAHHDRVILIKRLSKLNVSTQRRQRWEAALPRDDPDTFDRIRPEDLDYDAIERAAQYAAPRNDDLRNEIWQALIVDLLEGRCCYDNLQKRAKHHSARHYQQSIGKWGNRSMNETASHERGASLEDRIAWRLWK